MADTQTGPSTPYTASRALEALDRRGLLGDPPSVTLLSVSTFVVVLVLSVSMFLFGSLGLGTPGLIAAGVAMAGLAVAVGSGLAILQYRWGQRFENAQQEIVVLLDELSAEREHHRRVVHDAKAAVAALGAAVHGIAGLLEPKMVDAIERQLAQMRTVLDSKTARTAPFRLDEAFVEVEGFAALHRVDLVVRRTDLILVGDEQATIVVLRNLLDNARKYGGGSVRLWAEPAGPHHAHVIVEDDGPGVADDMVSSLFTPGVRAGFDKQGYGMGLAIAREAAEAQGGSLWYDPEWSGARFVMKMPVAAEEPQ